MKKINIIKQSNKTKRPKSIQLTIDEGLRFIRQFDRRNRILKQIQIKLKLQNRRKNLQATSPINKQKIQRINKVASKRISKKQNQIQKTNIQQNLSVPVPDMEVESQKESTQQNNFELKQSLGSALAGLIEACFVVDTTISMKSYLLQTKQTISSLVNKIREKTVGQPIELRFAFVSYRDHAPQAKTYLTKIQDFTNEETIQNFISKLDNGNGGDFSEAVLDGLDVAARTLSWTQSSTIPILRYIFHIGDAPPHGKEYGGFSDLWKSGCPCGLTIDQVSHEINIKEIHYRLIKCGTELAKMSKIFKSKISNFEETEIDKASQMDIKIQDMVIRELLPQ